MDQSSEKFALTINKLLRDNIMLMEKKNINEDRERELYLYVLVRIF